MGLQPPRIYFEDMDLGEEFTSPGRTVTEADVVNYAAFSGDWNQFHVNEEFAKKSVFGQRVAHGPLGVAIQPSMTLRTAFGFAEIVAMLGMAWRFVGPIRIGDTLWIWSKVVEKRETKKPDRGIVVFKRHLFNQRQEVVQEGEVTFMIGRRPVEP